MRKSLLFLVVFYISIAAGFAQQNNEISIDSLEKLRRETSEFISEYSYHKGIEKALKLVESSRKFGSDYYRYHGHNFLGVAYADLKDTARARKNYEFALKYAEKTGNDTIILRANNNLGNSYSENPKTTEEGIDLYKKVIKLSEKTNLPEESLAPKINIAWTYLDNKQPKLAFPYLDASRKMLRPEKDDDVLSQLYMLMGRYFEQDSKPDSAEVYYKESLKIAERDSLLLPASEVAKDYARLLFAQERYEEAYLSLSKHQDYNSKLFEHEKMEQVGAANARFDVSEYQKNLEIAQKEQAFQDQIIAKSNEKVIVMVISSFVLMGILLFLNKINQDRKRLIHELRVKNKQLKEAKEDAEKLSLLKTQFFSTVSHELRTPLYGVVGITSLLLEEESLKKHRNDLNSLKFSADYLLALINDVLQMNKMESNLVKLEKINFKLRELVLGIVNSFEFTRLQNQNKIHFQIDKKIPEYLEGDPVRLSQVLMNLVGNAMKFTERGNIYISAKLNEKTSNSASIYFEVRDDGMGIPKNKQELIFEEFSQLRTSNYNYQGTGLGLPIVKKLLELFNSDIYLESEEGKGSCFSFDITFALGIAATEQLGASANLVEDSGENKTVLIVDDNRINQVVTQRIMEKKNFTCEVASSGEEAIEMVKKITYNLILMDVNMPGISGLEATKRIREFNTEVPVLALTAVEIEEIRNQIFEAGMNDIIVKPYDVQQFYQIVYRNLNLNLINELNS